MPETYANRLKIGIVVPSTNTTVQPDCDDLRPPGVTNHVARILIPERPLTDEAAYRAHLEAMRAGIGEALRQVMSCGPGQIVMAVAIEAFSGGLAGTAKLKLEIEAASGVGVALGSSATDAALKAFGARRIALLTPHMPLGDAMVRGWFEEAGFDIVRFRSFRCKSPLAIAEVSEAEMRAALRELDGPEVEAIVQVGTNMQFMRLASAAERVLGKPVLAINAVTYWQALRQAGIADRFAGHGRIFEQH
jgi:maleate isomerase